MPVVIWSFCARQSKPQTNEDCKKLNSRGVDSLLWYGATKKKSALNAALNLLNEAIKCDSNLRIAKINKISVLGELGQYHDALQMIDLILVDKDSSLLILKSAYYEKLNERELSIKTYKIAYSYFSSQLKKHPENVNAIYCKLLTQSKVFGKDSITSEIQYYLKKYPNDGNLKALLEGI